MEKIPERVILWTVNFGSGMEDHVRHTLQNSLQPEISRRFYKRALYGSGTQAAKAEIGQRGIYDGNLRIATVPDLVGRVFLDGQLQEEYFVPIPVKCLGDLMENHGLPHETRQAHLIKDITKYHKLINRSPHVSFWTPGSGSGRMLTMPHKGYYQILRDYGDAKHILIGYSQGGVVARFLAFLDEYVFQENRILGVITVGSPNFGSPLANTENRENVADGLVEAALALFSFHEEVFTELVSWSRKRISFDDILSILEGARLGFARDSKIALFAQDRTKSYMHELTLGILLRWFGGLRMDQDNAFFDMNISHLDRPFSVLSLIHRFPPKRIYHGSVINGDSVTAKLFRSFLTGLPGNLFDLVSGRIRLFGKNFSENLSTVDEILMTRIMRESREVPGHVGDVTSAVLRLKREGVAQFQDGISMRLPPHSHDFIVPCAYQITTPGNPETFLGNLWNPDANHANGYVFHSRSGKKTLAQVTKLLELMRDRIQGTGGPPFDLDV